MNEVLVEKFVTHRGAAKAPATRVLYRLVAKQFLAHVAHDVTAQTPLSAAPILTYLTQICDTNAGSSVATKMTILAVFIAWCATEGLAAKALTELCVAPAYPHPVPRTASPDEVAVLLDNPPRKLATALLLATGLGLRESEIRSLQWGAIDLTPGDEQVTVIGKGSKLRVLPITDPVLVAHLSAHRGADAAYVVPGECGKMLTRGVLGDRLARYCDALGIRRLNMHSLRHGAASRWAMSGVPSRVVQGMLGHASLQTTEHYLSSLGNVDMLRQGMQRTVTAVAANA